MMCSAQALLPASIALGLAGLGYLAAFTSSSPPLFPSALLPVSSLPLLPALAVFASALFKGSHQLPSSFP